MTIYDNMQFPPYQFREYPKRITLIDGNEVEVSSMSEELSYATMLRPAQKDPRDEERLALAQQVMDQASKINELNELLAKAKADAEEAAAKAKAAAGPAVTKVSA